jgi:hypothetical protein
MEMYKNNVSAILFSKRITNTFFSSAAPNASLECSIPPAKLLAGAPIKNEANAYQHITIWRSRL